jgi:hypothetical protein
MEARMKTGLGRALFLTATTAVALAWVGGIGGSAAAMASGSKNESKQQLNLVIQRAIRADGPLFTPAEQAVINAKCGYAPGQWDGYQFSMTGDVLICTNGKRVDDPEVHALMEVAGPRIGRRVSAAMARPEVNEAIARVADEAAHKAMAELARRDWRLRR